MPGSRPGGLIAATWAAMVAMGREGYERCCEDIMASANQIKQGIKSIAGIKLLGKPEASVVAFGSSDSAINIYKVGEAMKQRHWDLNSLQNPASLHICCTYVHRDHAERFLKDLQESLAEVRTNPAKFKSDAAQIYGVAEALGSGSEASNGIINDMAVGFIDALYATKRPE